VPLRALLVSTLGQCPFTDVLAASTVRFGDSVIGRLGRRGTPGYFAPDRRRYGVPDAPPAGSVRSQLEGLREGALIGT
jgi:hypothetical protein